MDLNLTEEQQAFRDSVVRFVEKEGSTSSIQETWNSFAELGWLSLGFEEEFGGFPDSDVELMLLAEAFGKGGIAAHYYSSVVLCGTALSLAGTPEQKSRLIPAIISGETRAAFAHAEPERHYGLENISCAASRDADGFRLTGTKTMVLDGPHADYFLTTACVDGNRDISLFLVPADTVSTQRRDFTTTDGQRASEVTFEGARIGIDLLLGKAHEGLAIVEEATDRTTAALCADAVGAMRHLFETTLDYVKTRTQFDRSIGSFQAVQHRLADLYVELELAKAISLYANLQLQKPAQERKLAISQAKVQLVQAAQQISRQAIQLHGGMGMTEEYHVGHYFKRLIAFEAWLGNMDYHARRIENLQSSQ
ncbi:MAG: acyl-CoA dehydrogenase family protein [Aquisalinus sp.]|nr:acyl-CoA dehydrogenase family protein [Aquisalinus sp.]